MNKRNQSNYTIFFTFLLFNFILINLASNCAENLNKISSKNKILAQKFKIEKKVKANPENISTKKLRPGKIEIKLIFGEEGEVCSENKKSTEEKVTNISPIKSCTEKTQPEQVSPNTEPSSITILPTVDDSPITSIPKPLLLSSGTNLESAQFIGDVIKACYKSIVDTVSPDFCWIKDGNFGKIPSGCPSGWTKSLALCYKNCNRDYQYVLGRCYNGSDSYQPDVITNYSDMVSCPYGYYKSGALCYKDCKYIGMENCGIGTCVSDSANCGLTIASMVADSIMGVVSFISVVLTAGTASVATTAAKDAAKNGISKLSNEAKKLAFDKIKNSFSNFFTATVRKAKKAFIDNLKDIPTQLSAEFYASTYCAGVYDSIKTTLEKKSEPKEFDLESFGKQFDVLGISSIAENCRDSDKGAECAKSALSTAANFDPTGLLTIAAAFVHPTCEISPTEDRIEVRKVLNNFRNLCEINECKTYLSKDSVGDKNIRYLDRHDIHCSDGSVLNSIAFKREDDKLVVEYRCYSSISITNTCKTEYTAWNDFTKSNGAWNYFDRHDVNCSDSNYVLKGFQMETNNTDVKIRVRYTCCMVINSFGLIDFKTNRNDVSSNYDSDNLKNTDAIQGGSRGGLKKIQMRASSNPNKWSFDYKINLLDFDYSYDSNYVDKQTEWNDAGEGSIWFLDRHTLNCDMDNSGINRFFYERNGERIRYNYRCLVNKKISNNCYEDYTPWNDIDGNEHKSVNFLDRHKPNCKIDYVMKAFGITRSPRPENLIRYTFTCCKADYNSKYNNRYDKTDLGNYNTYYLDRQIVSLGPDEVLSGFKLDVSYDPNLMDLTYEAKILK